MPANLGALDRSLRLILGIMLLVAAFAFKNIWPALVGIILLGTAIASRCPLYLPFGFSSRTNK